MTSPTTPGAATSNTAATQQPGDTYVQRRGIIGSLVLAIAFAAMLAYTLMAFLPRTVASEADERKREAATAATISGTGADSGRGASATVAVPVDSLWCAQADSLRSAARRTHPDTTVGHSCLAWFGFAAPIPFEWRLYWIVFFAGMFGATIHMLRSLAWYIGNRDLKWSWLAYLTALPIVGAFLGTAFYVVIRGGFFNYPEGKVYGFAAIAMLVGMFTTPAALRLKEIAEAMLTKGSPGADATPQGTGADGSPPKGALWIKEVTRLQRATGAPADALRITGSGFSAQIGATVNGKTHPVRYVKEDTLELPLDAKDLNVINAGGTFDIVLRLPDGKTSNTVDFS